MQETVDYPTKLEVDYPESPSRVLALLGVIFFLKALLLIPHLIVISILGLIATVVIWIGYLAVLITGSYPAGLFSFVLGVQRWGYRTNGWFAGFTDRYPPFSLGAAEDYGVRFEVDRPESSSRILALLGVLFFFPKLVLLIPHLIILYFLGILTLVVVYIAYWAVLITGTYPRGLFDFAVGMMRWETRTDSWFIGFTDRYPPFSLR